MLHGHCDRLDEELLDPICPCCVDLLIGESIARHDRLARLGQHLGVLHASCSAQLPSAELKCDNDSHCSRHVCCRSVRARVREPEH